MTDEPTFVKAMEVVSIIMDKEEDEGEIECPKCGGTITYHHRNHKKHLRAWCSTEGCIQLMA